MNHLTVKTYMLPQGKFHKIEYTFGNVKSYVVTTTRLLTVRVRSVVRDEVHTKVRARL